MQDIIEAEYVNRLSGIFNGITTLRQLVPRFCPPNACNRTHAQWRSTVLTIHFIQDLMVDALRKCISKGPYTPTIVTNTVVPALEDLSSSEQTTVETVRNMTPVNRVTVGGQVCKSMGYSVLTARILVIMLRMQKAKKGTDSTYHKEKDVVCKQQRKCLAEPDVQVPLEEIEIDENLHFVEEPIKIVERDVKKLKRRRIPLVNSELISAWRLSLLGTKMTNSEEIYRIFSLKRNLLKCRNLSLEDKALLTGGDYNISYFQMQRKEQQDKLNAVKACLLYGNETGKNQRNHEESHYSESKTPTARTEPKMRHENRRPRSPKSVASVFKRLKRNRPPSPRPRPRKEGGVFNKLGGKERSASARSDGRQSSHEKEIEVQPREHHHRGTSSRETGGYSESEDSRGGHWKSKSRRHRIRAYLGSHYSCFEQGVKAPVRNKKPDDPNYHITHMIQWRNHLANKLDIPTSKIGDEEHSTSAWMNFMVIRSPSQHNGIIGRTGIKKIRAIPSMAHGMLKFLVKGGTVTIRSSRVIPIECAMISGPSTQHPVTSQMLEEKIKVAIHPEYLEQTIAI
ncbi:hypothetical protein Tco_0413305 [Tanacetum coccineum]